MLNRYGDTFEATCDFCDDQIDTHECDFQSAVDELKRQNWKIFKTGGEWQHKCSDCCSGNGDDFDVVKD